MNLSPPSGDTVLASGSFVVHLSTISSAAPLEAQSCNATGDARGNEDTPCFDLVPRPRASSFAFALIREWRSRVDGNRRLVDRFARPIADRKIPNDRSIVLFKKVVSHVDENSAKTTRRIAQSQDEEDARRPIARQASPCPRSLPPKRSLTRSEPGPTSAETSIAIDRQRPRSSRAGTDRAG